MSLYHNAGYKWSFIIEKQMINDMIYDMMDYINVRPKADV